MLQPSKEGPLDVEWFVVLTEYKLNCSSQSAVVMPPENATRLFVSSPFTESTERLTLGRAGFGHRAETEEEEIDQRFDRVHRHGKIDVRDDVSAIGANGNPNRYLRPPNGERRTAKRLCVA